MPHRGNGENNEEGSGSGDAAAAAPEMTTWLRLTNGTGSVGAAWYNSPLHLANGFEARFTTMWLDPGAPDGRVSPQFGGGLAFVVHSDGRRDFAIGCNGGGLGFQAEPNPRKSLCVERIYRGIALSLLADRVEVVRTEADFASPMARAYYSLGRRLDDGNMHTIRLQYISASGGSLTVFVDDMNVPQLHVSPIDFGRYALSDDGEGLAGFTAASGTGTDDAVTVEVHSWQLAASEVAHEANEARFPKSQPSSVSPAAIREEYSAALAGLQPLEAATRGPSN